MSEARKKLEVLYEDGLGDIDAIVKRIEKLSADTGNLTTAINKFNDAEVLMDKKLDDINSVTKLYNENICLALIATFICTATIGGGVGYIILKEQLQASVFGNELKKVTDARLKFEEENQSKMLAEKNGVIFYSDGISIPTKTPDMAAAEGHAIYRYPKNNPSPPTKK